jgi:DNA-binding transcriptional LysR family regulator
MRRRWKKYGSCSLINKCLLFEYIIVGFEIMDRLQSMRAFVQVADSGGFAKAGEVLGMSPAVMTRAVAELEAHLGVRLLQRTTRTVGLTDAGTTYLERARQTLFDLEEAETEARALTAKPRGVLRLHCPVPFSRTFLPEVIKQFHAKYPEVTFDLTVSDRLDVNLVEEGYDLAVMIVPDNVDKNVAARLLYSGKLMLCASEAYLKRHGEPQHPRELPDHMLLTLNYPGIRDRWDLQSEDGDSFGLNITPVLASNSPEWLRGAAQEGAGITISSCVVVQDGILRGELKRVLPQWNAGGYSVYAAYPSRRYLSAKVRLFLDKLTQIMQDRIATTASTSIQGLTLPATQMGASAAVAAE